MCIRDSIDAIIGDPDRLHAVAEDFINHYETRVAEGATVAGKATVSYTHLLCRIKLPVPSYARQCEIVESYRAITDRIALKRAENDNLAA